MIGHVVGVAWSGVEPAGRLGQPWYLNRLTARRCRQRALSTGRRPMYCCLIQKPRDLPSSTDALR
jgi:hypothetical protein